jgi:hypothetical protein
LSAFFHRDERFSGREDDSDDVSSPWLTNASVSHTILQAVVILDPQNKAHQTLLFFICNILVDHMNSSGKDKTLPLVDCIIETAATAGIVGMNILLVEVLAGVQNAIVDSQALGNSPATDSKLIHGLPKLIATLSARIVSTANATHNCRVAELMTTLLRQVRALQQRRSKFRSLLTALDCGRARNAV